MAEVGITPLFSLDAVEAAAPVVNESEDYTVPLLSKLEKS